jgi:cytochrome c biogenesis protein CcdA
VATGLTFGLVFAPRSTRLLASILSAVAISDACNHGYLRLKESDRSP